MSAESCAERLRLVRELDRFVVPCSLDELRVLVWVAEGIHQGRTVYGPMDLASDNRDFRAEQRQELRDFLVYAAAEALKHDG